MGGNIESGPHIGLWVAEQISGTYHQGSTAIGLKRNGEIVAGVLYENWNGKSLTAHMAVTGLLTPGYIAAIFDYAYRVCGVAKVICPVDQTNKRSMKLLRNMGFVAEAKLKNAAPDGDILLYTLDRADCRFIGDRYGQKCAIATRGT